MGTHTYRGFHEKGTFSVHSFNDDYLSIHERPGSYKYLFHEIPVTSIKQLIYRKLEFLKTKKWLVWIDIAMKHFTKKDYKYSVLM